MPYPKSAMVAGLLLSFFTQPAPKGRYKVAQGASPGRQPWEPREPNEEPRQGASNDTFQ